MGRTKTLVVAGVALAGLGLATSANFVTPWLLEPPTTAQCSQIAAIPSSHSDSTPPAPESAPERRSPPPTPSLEETPGAPSFALKIRTVTSEGVPVPGCAVELRQSGASSLVRDSISHAMQESSLATHTIESLPAGIYQVVIVRPTVKESICEVAWSGDRDRELSVPVGSIADLIAGRVLRRSSEPVPGVLVDDVLDVTTSAYGITDVAGRFVFLRRNGQTELSASFVVDDWSGSARISRSAVPHTLTWGELDQVVVCEDRRSLNVFVLDHEGTPVSRFVCRVEALLPDGRQVSRSAVATEGTAVISDCPTGKVRVQVVPPEPYAPQWGDGNVDASGRGDLVLHVTPGTPLRGAVRAGGETARVELAPLSHSGQELHELEALQPYMPIPVIGGKFELMADPRSSYVLSATAPGHAKATRVIVPVNGLFDTCEIHLEPLATIEFSVSPPEALDWLKSYAQQQQAAERNPMHGFSLVALPPSTATRVTADVSAPSKVTLRDVTRGDWILWHHGPWTPVRVAIVHVSEERLIVLPDLQLEHLRPGLVSGTVTTSGDDMTVGRLALVSEGRRIRALVSADGTYSLTAPAGTYRLHLECTRRGKSLTLVSASPVDLLAGATVTVNPKAEARDLQLRVVDNVTGAPIRGVSVSIDEERQCGSYQIRKTEETGMVTLAPAPIGDFHVSTMEPGSRVWTNSTRVSGSANGIVEIRISSP